MTIQQFESHQPKIGERTYIDPNATIIGNVEIADDCSIWPGAVIRGDIHSIKIGNRNSIQDNSVIHVTHASDYYPNGYPTSIGDDVTVGHRVILHGCTIESRCLIGMGSIIMDGAIVHNDVIIGAGSLVSPGKELESGYLWLGSPIKKQRKLTKEELTYLTYAAQHYVELKNRYLQQT